MVKLFHRPSGGAGAFLLVPDVACFESFPWWVFPLCNPVGTGSAHLQTSSGCLRSWNYKIQLIFSHYLGCCAVSWPAPAASCLRNTATWQLHTFCRPEDHLDLCLGQGLQCCKDSYSSSCWGLCPVVCHHYGWGWVWGSEQRYWPFVCAFLYLLLPSSLVRAQPSNCIDFSSHWF